MQLLFEILPVFLFFLTFKIYGIYAATLVGIIATFIQLLITRIFQRKWDKKQGITLAIFMIFGGMTLYFHDPIFVKWKPTIIFWIFAVVLLITQFFTKKPLMQRMMESMLEARGQVPQSVWKYVNFFWALFFSVMGAVNLYIAYTYNDDVWVNFKFYGITISFLVFSIIQALYLSRFLIEGESKE